MWEAFWIILLIVYFLASLDMTISTQSRGWKKDIVFFFFWPIQWLFDWANDRL